MATVPAVEGSCPISLFQFYEEQPHRTGLDEREKAAPGSKEPQPPSTDNAEDKAH